MKTYDVYLEASDMFTIDAETKDDAKDIAVDAFLSNPGSFNINTTITNERELEEQGNKIMLVGGTPNPYSLG